MRKNKHVALCKIIENSLGSWTPRCGFRIGFQVLDCGFPVGWNLPVFPELKYRSQCPGLQIPRAKISRILKSRLPYMGRNMGEILCALFPRIPWFSWKQGTIGAGLNSSQACVVLELVKRDYSRKRIRYNRLYQGLRLSATQVRGRPVAD